MALAPTSLLHFNGDDESTTIVDSSSEAWTGWSCWEGSLLDTAQKKFGSASLLNGVFVWRYLWVDLGEGDEPDSAWYIGLGDFTLDCWVRFNALPSVANDRVNLAVSEYDLNWWKWGIELVSTGPNVWKHFFRQYYDSTADNADVESSEAIVTDTWYHFAVARASDNYIRFYQDGVYIGKVSYNIDIQEMNWFFWAGQANEASYRLNGWMDEARFINGEAAYTADSNFTPPTEEYGEGGMATNDGLMNSPIYTCEGTSAGVNLGDEWMVEESPTYELLGSGSVGAVGDMSYPLYTLSGTSGAHADDQESPKFVLSGTGSKFAYGETPSDLKSPAYSVSATGTLQRTGNASMNSPIWTITSTGHDTVVGICTQNSPIYIMSGTGSLGRFDSYILRYVRP